MSHEVENRIILSYIKNMLTLFEEKSFSWTEEWEIRLKDGEVEYFPDYLQKDTLSALLMSNNFFNFFCWFLGCFLI